MMSDPTSESALAEVAAAGALRAGAASAGFDLTGLPAEQAHQLGREFAAAIQAAEARGYALGRAHAADQVEAAMRAESDRLAAGGDGRSVEQGMGVAKAMRVVIRAARGGSDG